VKMYINDELALSYNFSTQRHVIKINDKKKTIRDQR